MRRYQDGGQSHSGAREGAGVTEQGCGVDWRERGGKGVQPFGGPHRPPHTSHHHAAAASTASLISFGQKRPVSSSNNEEEGADDGDGVRTLGSKMRREGIDKEQLENQRRLKRRKNQPQTTANNPKNCNNDRTTPPIPSNDYASDLRDRVQAIKRR